MTFNLAPTDNDLISAVFVKLENVTDVGNHPIKIIKFQFPPRMTADSKSAKWEAYFNTIGYEPQHRYDGANPRKIKMATTYVIGGPTGGGSGNWDIDAVRDQVNAWKSYFYFANLANGEGGGGGVALGKNLPIFRIIWGKLLAPFAPYSSWRATDYNIKYSDTWIREADGAYPLITDVTMNLELVTQADVTGKGDPKQDHPNLIQFAPPVWY